MAQQADVAHSAASRAQAREQPQNQDSDSQASDKTSTTLGGRPKSTKPSYKHIPHSQKPPHLVAKRNARERRRVQAVNQAFYRLRKSVPIENRNKRVSKVKTLQRAIDYIRKLERVLAEDDAATNHSSAAATLSSSSSSALQCNQAGTNCGNRVAGEQQFGPSEPGKLGAKLSVTRASGPQAERRRPAGKRQQQNAGADPALAGKPAVRQRRGRKPKQAAAELEGTAAAASAQIPNHLDQQNGARDQLYPTGDYAQLPSTTTTTAKQVPYCPLGSQADTTCAGVSYGRPREAPANYFNNHHQHYGPLEPPATPMGEQPYHPHGFEISSSSGGHANEQYTPEYQAAAYPPHWGPGTGQQELTINHAPAYHQPQPHQPHHHNDSQQQHPHRYAAWHHQQPAVATSEVDKQILALAASTNKDVARHDEEADKAAGPCAVLAADSSGTRATAPHAGLYLSNGGPRAAAASHLMAADSTSAPPHHPGENKQKQLTQVAASPSSLARSSPASVSSPSTTLKSLDLSGNSSFSTSTSLSDKSSPASTSGPATSTTAYATANPQRLQQQVNNYLPTRGGGHSAAYHLSNFQRTANGQYGERTQPHQTPGEKQSLSSARLHANEGGAGQQQQHEQNCTQQNGSRSSSMRRPQVLSQGGPGGDYLANNNLHGNNNDRHHHHQHPQAHHQDGQLFHSTYYGHHQNYHNQDEQHYFNSHHQVQQQQQQSQLQRHKFLGNQARLQRQQLGQDHLSDRSHHLQLTSSSSATTMATTVGPSEAEDSDPSANNLVAGGNQQSHELGMHVVAAHQYTILPL